MHWLTVGPADQPGVNLVLTPPAADPGVTDDERGTITEMMAKGTYAILTLATADLDATFEKLQASDVDIVQEPIDQPYGIRDCAVRDPSGNLDPDQRGEVMTTCTHHQAGHPRGRRHRRGRGLLQGARRRTSYVEVGLRARRPVGFRGFPLSLVCSQPANVDAVVDAALDAGATVLKPAEKSFWGYGGVVQAPDGTSGRWPRRRRRTPAPRPGSSRTSCSCSASRTSRRASSSTSSQGSTVGEELRRQVRRARAAARSSSRSTRARPAPRTPACDRRGPGRTGSSSGDGRDLHRPGRLRLGER